MNNEREHTMERIADIRDQLETRIMGANQEIQDLGGLEFHVAGVMGRFLQLGACRIGSETTIAYWDFIDVCRFDLPPSWRTPERVDAFVVGEPASSGPGRWSMDPEVSVIQVRGIPHGSCTGETFSVMARLCSNFHLLEDHENPQVEYWASAYVQGRMKTYLELLEAGVVDVCVPRRGLDLRDETDVRSAMSEARRRGLKIIPVRFDYQLRFPDASIVASPERTTYQVILYLPEAEAKARELQRLLTEPGSGEPERWRQVGELLGYSDAYIAQRLEEQRDGR